MMNSLIGTTASKTALAFLVASAAITPSIVMNVDVAEASTPNADTDFTVASAAGGGVEILFYTGVSKDVVIPSTIGGKPVVSIANNAFEKKVLTSVVIPDSVKTIGFSSFAGNKLTNVVIPEGVTMIGVSAFTDNLLTSVTLPDSLTDLNNGAFDKNKLTSVAIPKGLSSISDNAFRDNKLTSLTIPANITSLGAGAFATNELASLSLPNTLTSLPDNVFSSNKLTSVTIPDGVMSIGSMAFYQNLLTDAVIPGSVKTIGANAFLANQLVSSDLTIWGADPSAAKTYATQNQHTFNEGVPTPPAGSGGGGSEQDVTLNLQGGDLTLASPDITSFGLVNLSAQAQTVRTGFTDSFGVTDARGTGEGWRLAVNATPFEVVEPESGFVKGTSAHALPAGTLTLKPLAAIARQGVATGAEPTSQMKMDSIIDSGAVTVANANVNEGMGDFKLSFEEDALGLIIDSATAKIDKVNYPDTSTPYESTVTWTLVTGP